MNVGTIIWIMIAGSWMVQLSFMCDAACDSARPLSKVTCDGVKRAASAITHPPRLAASALVMHHRVTRSAGNLVLTLRTPSDTWGKETVLSLLPPVPVPLLPVGGARQS